MSSFQFQQVKQAVSSTPFDDRRLIIAKQAISESSVSSNQVLELMDLFSFENSKMKLVKFAYNHVADPQNYYVVNNGFTFNSSVNELNGYLSMY